MDFVKGNRRTFYSGMIEPRPNVIFVFGSNPEGRHGLGAAKTAVERFGAIYGQGEGMQGHSYALPTKDLRVKANYGYRSIPPEQIVANIGKLYATARQFPNMRFCVAYTNTTKRSLNGYTGVEMAKMFIAAAGRPDNIPENIIFSEQWFHMF